MRRIATWLGWVLAVLIGLPLLLLVGGNTDIGRGAIEHLVSEATGGEVQIAGLSGRFPDALRAARLELRDPSGVYLSVADAQVDWSPLELMQRELVIERLQATRVALQRLPQSSSSSSSTSLPVRVIVHAFHIDRFDLAAPVAGFAAALAVDGSGELDDMAAGSVRLTAQQIGGDGRYQVDAAINATDLHANVTASEPPHGLLGGLTGLPDLAATTLDARLNGPRSAVATQVTVVAGPLRASLQGQVDLQHESADLSVTASASAMTPRPDLSWQSVSLNAQVHGSFARPNVTGQLQIDAITAAGASVGSVSADVSGNAGQAKLHAELSALRVPGAPPDLLGDSPLLLDASIRLDAPDRPLQFSLRHKLATAEGLAQTAGALRGEIKLSVPDLTPLAAVAGADVHGSLALTLQAAMQGATAQLTADGRLTVIGGPSVVGDSVHLSGAATVQGENVTLNRLQVDARDAKLSATGNVAGSAINLDWQLAIADLAALQPTLTGEIGVNGHIGGTRDNLSATADVSGDIGTQGSASAPLTARLEVGGVPDAPSGTLTARGALLGAPLDLAIKAERRDGAFHVAIDRADWKSAHAEGTLSLTPPATLPAGTLKFSMQRLDDLAPLLGRSVAGSLSATLTADTKLARLAAELRSAGLPGVATASRIALDATVTGPDANPMVDAILTLDGVAARGVGGSATLRAQGPQNAVALSLTANVPALAGAAAKVTASGKLDAQARALDVGSLQVVRQQQTLRLLAPVRIAFANGITIDRLRVGLQQAVLEASGRIAPTLDLTATLRNLPADIAPGVAVDGTIGAEVRLTGTTAQPIGTVSVTAKGLHMRTGPGRVLPAADIQATAKLAGSAAQIDARLAAGSSRLTLNGRAPLAIVGPVDIRAAGSLDLALLNPLLAANGRRVSGKLDLNATIGGTIAAPMITGNAQLANGEVQDYVQSAHITGITARLDASGGTVRLQADGKAGPGTLSASGTIGVQAPGMPVDLRLTARNAQPLASDLITALIDADLTLRGELVGALTVGGSLQVRRAEIRVPEKLPGSIATIPVRTAGAPPPPPPAPGPDIALNLTLDAPEQVFVRGRGLDAELGGKMHLQGTVARPQADGGLTLRRGSFSFAGQTLTFTQGTIGFNGAGLTNPAINLVASSTSNSVTATLTVGGTAQNPTITLASTPELPQDEVLAQLLFKRRVGSLGPFELAQIAAALASLTGGPSIDNPLASLRKNLGLDRLGVGTSSTGAPTLEAGRYLAPGIYLGAKQGVSGGGSQATVQVDIAKGLKLEATTGAGSSNSATGAAGDTNGSSIGLTYQFEY